jgi:PleD family two-component response regulator
MATADFAELAVLIINDNKAERSLFVRVLHALGIVNIREAGTRKDAISHLGRFQASLVLGDFARDQSEGILFAKWVRTAPESSNPFVPIILLMAKPSVQEVKDALDAGVNEIMIKPATIKGVGDRIRAVLENPREFVRVDAYVGPDRRRRDKPDFKGPERRRRR